MKKILFFAVAAIALLATSCTVEPTEINANDLNDKVYVHGFVRYTPFNSQGKAADAVAVGKQAIILYYGIKEGDKMNYQRYDLVTNRDGYFSTNLGVRPGQVIDEVKVQCRLFVEEGSYAYNKKTKKYVLADTEFFAEVVKKDLTAGSSFFFDVDMVPVAYTSDPDLRQPDEKEEKPQQQEEQQEPEQWEE